jgi:hypothetical protein
LEASIARHKASLREHREECVEIENRHKATLEKLSKAHKRELDDMLEILGLADLDRDESLKRTADAKRQNTMLSDELNEITALMHSWATAQDDTAIAVKHWLGHTPP